MHTYGSHVFHASNAQVWRCVDRSGAFDDHRHHVWTLHRGQACPVPISFATTSQSFGRRSTPRGPAAADGLPGEGPGGRFGSHQHLDVHLASAPALTAYDDELSAAWRWAREVPRAG